MQIHFPLLSILSVGFLLFFALQGGDVELHSIEVGIVTTLDGVRVTIDPAFIVWGNVISGMTYGNVAVLAPYLNTPLWAISGAWVKQFEINHIAQFRALSWWVYPACFVLPIDPVGLQCNSNDPTEPNRLEWLPPADWRDQWHFITIAL